MSLYNAKQTSDGLRITKFTDDLDVESSYITSRDVCECPAGHRDTCRHRQMVPEFKAANRIDKSWFLDWDNHRWYYYSAEAGQLMDRQPSKWPAWRRI